VEDAHSSVEIDLLDYERVRDEIDSRTSLSSQLLNYDLVIIGAVLSAYDKLPHEVTAVVSCISCVFWLMWLDHTSQIYKLAAYVELALAPRLRSMYPDVLKWEYFLRELDSGGERAEKVLYGAASSKKTVIPQTGTISRYISILFGGSAIALLVVFLNDFYASILNCFSSVTKLDRPASLDALHLGLAIAAIVLLIYAYSKNNSLKRFINTVGDAVKQRSDRPPASTPRPATATGRSAAPHSTRSNPSVPGPSR
jgi:hypothetical protein